MSLYLADSTDLTAVASAIRTKGGTSAQLEFPDEFVSAIAAIPSGSSGIHNLPAGYTELEYIESSGTQYINTGYVAVEDSQIQSVHVRTANQGTAVCEWGSKSTPNIHCQSNLFAFGSLTDKSITGFIPNSMCGYYTAIINKNGLSDMFGTLHTTFSGYTWDSGNDPIFIFARNNAGTAERHSKMRLYYWVAKENGIKKVEFFPAIRNSDNVVGLYESVSGTFFTNAGTGTFTGGAY